MRNRTADLLLTMETLCLLSYEGKPKRNLTGPSMAVQNELVWSELRCALTVVDWLQGMEIGGGAPPMSAPAVRGS